MPHSCQQGQAAAAAVLALASLQAATGYASRLGLYLESSSGHEYSRAQGFNGDPGGGFWVMFGVVAVDPVLLSPRDGGEVGMEGGGSGLEVEPHHVAVVHGVPGHGAAAT